MILSRDQTSYQRSDVDALLRENEELRAVNRDLEVVAYAIAHDLRAPLRTIGGFAELLSADLGEVSAAVARDMAGIRATVGRMQDMLMQWLSLLHKGRAALERVPVDITALAESVVQELCIAHPARCVGVDIQPGLSAAGDPGLIRELLQNVIGNAWKFTERKDDARISVGAYQDRNDTVFYVRDNGVGFESTDRVRLFEPFVRLHSEQLFAGTGVGLAIAQRIVERHGGRIWAQSTPGDGATFKFLLPQALPLLADFGPLTAHT